MDSLARSLRANQGDQEYAIEEEYGHGADLRLQIVFLLTMREVARDGKRAPTEVGIRKVIYLFGRGFLSPITRKPGDDVGATRLFDAQASRLLTNHRDGLGTHSPS
jgi:hypothetical protein